MDEVRVPACPDLRVGLGAVVVIWGQPGAGKSELAARWLASFTGPTVYYAAEEGIGVTVGERLRRVGAPAESMRVVGQTTLDDLARLCVRAKALLIDSITVTTLSPKDVRTLSLNLRLPVVFVVSQVTKDGSLRGTNELLHEADLGVEVTAGKWRVVKSRYQPLGDTPSGDVFPSVPSGTHTFH
jgi:predicted ATP-dependent serine protease